MLQATIAVDLDVPHPFSLTPKVALEAAGNAAFDTTLKIMLDGEELHLQADIVNIYLSHQSITCAW